MKAGLFSSISTTLLFVVTVTACSDATGPTTPVATVNDVMAVQTPGGSVIPENSEVALMFDDAGSRLMLSFPASESAIELKAGLLAAAASLRSGDMTAASAAITAARSALNAIDARGSNPDAAAIRLVLNHGSQASASLAVESL